MLSGYQCVVIAYISDGGIICEECALRDNSTVALAQCERGLSNSTGLDPLIRYSLDEIIGENASEYADSECDYSEDPTRWQEIYDSASDSYPCDSCGKDIS